MQRMNNRHLRVVTTLLLSMALAFSTIIVPDLKVSAAEAIPDGAYNPDTYEPKDYVIPHGISDDTSTGRDYLDSIPFIRLPLRIRPKLSNWQLVILAAAVRDIMMRVFMLMPHIMGLL